ncbi:MAG: nucleotidyltransferase family protein [Desulfobacterales bacterium]
MKSETSPSPVPFTSVVLAGDRGPGDPVARAAGVRCKVLAPVGGKPMLERVLDALRSSPWVSSCLVCGPAASVIEREPRLRALFDREGIAWAPPEGSPSRSVLAALDRLAGAFPVLVTTGDHALLSRGMVDLFCEAASACGGDLAAGLTSWRAVMEAYPGTRRTRTRFRDGPFCGCNLFAFLTPRSRRAAVLWREVEAERKHPLRMIRRLGWGTLLRYAAGRLSLAEGLERVSRRMGLRVRAVVLPQPEAAIDVDSEADWRFAAALADGRLKPRGGGSGR